MPDRSLIKFPIALVASLLMVLYACEQPRAADDTLASKKPKAIEKAAEELPLGQAVAPSVAGGFYPDDPAQLRSMVENFIQKAKKQNLGNTWAYLVPHAGYRFSGAIAGSTYRQLMDRPIDRVVLIGFVHRPLDRYGQLKHEGIGTVLSPSFTTPLGEIPVDVDEVRRLVSKEPLIANAPGLFADEHSLEVQLPFLQVALPKAKIVPLMFGARHDLEEVAQLADLLVRRYSGQAGTVVLASTDMSHFFTHEEAVRKDHEAIRLVQQLDTDTLIAKAPSREVEYCGLMGVLTVMMAQKKMKGGQPILLDYRNSGDTFGQKDSVVGYCAIAFPRKIKKTGKDNTEKKEGKMDYALSDGQKRQLLRLAKKTVEEFVRTGKKPDLTTEDPFLKELGAAFVTLKKNGQLRGCIGQTEARIPLWECVREMAVAACSQDPRFPPVKQDELTDLDYEVSVLTPMKKVANPEDIVVGRDGLLMEKGFYRGLLLPQVPEEWGWDREQFLSHTARKSGMPMDAWRDGSVTIYSFQAIVFDDDEFPDAD